MANFISNLIGNDYLATVLMSFVPLIELKGAIVFAWEKLTPVLAFLLAYVGSTIIYIPIFFLLKPILNALKKIKFFNKFANKVESYFSDKAQQQLSEQNAKASKGRLTEVQKKQWGVFIFVGIPLPMTGVWTGTAIAVFLNLRFKQTILPVTIGNFVAGLLICALSALCTFIGISLDLVLYCLFALALILLIVFIIKVARKKTKEANV